jgi:hypothetical protein
MGWVVNAEPGRFSPGKTPVSIVQEAGRAPEPLWTCAGNLAPPTGIRSPDRPGRSEWLYRLSYPGPACFVIGGGIFELSSAAVSISRHLLLLLLLLLLLFLGDGLVRNLVISRKYLRQVSGFAGLLFETKQFS